MALNIKDFTRVIRQLDYVQRSVIYLDVEHREILAIRMKMLNQELKNHGISDKELENIEGQSEMEMKKKKVRSEIERKKKLVNELKKEIMLSNKTLNGKKEQAQKKIQIDRLDRAHEETKDDF